jgi:glycosyltransferase involved in cell wall biosynthesis
VREKSRSICVIVPVYNTEKFLVRCLDSVISQTYQNLEIICVNDASPDNSQGILEKYAAKDLRMKSICHKNNCGLSAARNTGIKNSSAPFVMFVDSDDYIAPEFCEKLYEAITKHNTDMAVCGVNIENKDENPEHNPKSYFQFDSTGLVKMSDDFRNTMNKTVWNKIYRREIMEKNEIWFPDGLRNEDEYFFRAYCEFARTVFVLPEKLYFYCLRQDSIMGNIASAKGDTAYGNGIDSVKIAFAYIDFMKKHGLLEIRLEFVFETFFSLLSSAFFRDRSSRGRKEMFALVSDFIRREGWQTGDIPPHLRRSFEMLEKQTFPEEKRKILGGLIKIKETPGKKKIYFAQIPVWKTKQTQRKKQGYLFGFIRVCCKSAKDKSNKNRKGFV